MSPLFARVTTGYRVGFWIDANVYLVQIMDDFIDFARARRAVSRAPAVSALLAELGQAQVMGDYLHMADLLQYEIWPIVAGEVVFSELSSVDAVRAHEKVARDTASMQTCARG